jgi:hypothetical protein
VFGQRGQGPHVDLAEIGTPGDRQGYLISGDASTCQAGTAVASIGDINDDGTPDALIGGPQAETPAGRAGGRLGRVREAGLRGNDRSGELAAVAGLQDRGRECRRPCDDSAANAGEVNRDGTPDVLLGAPGAPRVAMLVFGLPHSSATPLNIADIGNPGNTQGTLFAGDMTGGAVGSAGDVNGDGVRDQLIGAPTTGSGNGTAFVVFGRDPLPERIDLSSVGSSAADPTGYLMATGHFSSVGASVANAGDVNNDGLADPLITGPFNTVNVIDEGSTWTVFSSLALPVPSTGPATAITPSSATLNGTVAHGAPTCQASPARFQFEYGTTTAYGSVTPVRPAPVGAGAERTPVSSPLAAVAPDTTLHYRLRATCGGAQTFGRDRTFTTAKAPPPPPPPPSWTATATIASSKVRVGLAVTPRCASAAGRAGCAAVTASSGSAGRSATATPLRPDTPDSRSRQARPRPCACSSPVEPSGSRRAAVACAPGRSPARHSHPARCGGPADASSPYVRARGFDPVARPG